MFFWFSGQYLGTGLGGDPHASIIGGSIDLAMEVANRVAVSASIPGALIRTQAQSSENIWGIGGPLEARVRVRLGPASPGFYSIEARPRWSSVVELRTQLLLPDFAGDDKSVGRVQRGIVQPAVYGAGELNLWRFQLAPGAGILVGDREAHLDLSLRASVQLLDRLFGDVEVLRRQALGVPAEPGRCQSAWMGAAGLRLQFRRGVFLSARYAGGQGDCVPDHSFLLNLGLAFGEGFMRIPTPDEVGFIKTWHALLMGMVDPVLDCQGIMRADDGTPMFRFGHLDPSDPNIIRRNHVAYRVGEHFWEKNGYLYRDTDLSTPVLDLHGESPLTFADRAAMHDCPTLPGLGSPCQVALNLPALRQSVERGDRPTQVLLTEDAQIVACLNHLSPLKAAAMFSSIEAALGPLLGKLPQVTLWGNPTAPAAPTASPGAAMPPAVAATPAQGPPTQTGGAPKVAMPAHSTPPHHGQRHRSKPGRAGESAEANESTTEPPHFPSLPGWPGGESSGTTAEKTPSSPPPAHGAKPAPAATQPSIGAQPAGTLQPPPTVVQHELPPPGTRKAPQPKPEQKGSAPARADSASGSIASAPAKAGEHGNPEPEPEAPLCGTKCQLSLGVGGVATVGVLAVGGEVAKDVVIGGLAAGGESIVMAGVATAGGAVAGKIAVDGVADHVMPPSGPTDPASPAAPDKPAAPATNIAQNGETPDNAKQPTVKRGRVDGDLTRLLKDATEGPPKSRVGAQGELDAIERHAQQGRNVEKLPERNIRHQGDPDLLFDGELVEVKTREEQLDDRWVKDMIGKANKQIKTSRYGDNPQGSVELQLKDQPESDSQLMQRAEAQVKNQFRADQSRSLTAVRIFNDGQLLAEWIRVGEQIVRVFSAIP